MIRSKGQVRMGHEDPCEAPPIILKKNIKKTKIQIMIGQHEVLLLSNKKNCNFLENKNSEVTFK